MVPVYPGERTAKLTRRDTARGWNDPKPTVTLPKQSCVEARRA
jgi:hypothetical protein